MHAFRLLLVFLLTIVTGASPIAAEPLQLAAPRAVGLSPERLQHIGDALRQDIEQGRIPGAVVAIARKGKLVYLEAFGFRDPMARVPMTTDTLFFLGSMSKPITIVGALKLVERGKLSLDDPIAKYLPAVGAMQVASADDDGPLATVAAARQMTIRDLMRHSSGIAYGGAKGVRKLYVPLGFGASLTSDEFIARLANLPLIQQPGTAWEYGLSIDVLGLVLEKVTGQTLGDYLGDQVFNPLGMDSTGFAWSAQKAGHYAKALPSDPDTGRPQAVPDPGKLRMECGGSCIISTASDYVRFGEMLLEKGKLDNVRVISDSMVEVMTSDQHGKEIRGFPQPGYTYGFGVAVRNGAPDPTFGGLPGRFFWNGLTGPSFWVDPQRDLVVVFMAHAPGRFREYHQKINSLVIDAIVD